MVILPPADNIRRTIKSTPLPVPGSCYGGSSSCYGEGNLGVLYFLLCFPKCPTWGTLWTLLPLGGLIDLNCLSNDGIQNVPLEDSPRRNVPLEDSLRRKILRARSAVCFWFCIKPQGLPCGSQSTLFQLSTSACCLSVVASCPRGSPT